MTQRVLYIIGAQDRPGARRQLALLARHLPRDEFEPHVCLLQRNTAPAEWLDHEPQMVHRISRRWPFDPRTHLELVRLMRRLQPAVVQSWLFEANVHARLAARSAGCRVTVAVERYLSRSRPWTERGLDRWPSGRTACLVTNSQAVLDDYVSSGVLPRLTEVIPEGVEPPAPPSLSRAELLRSLRVPSKVRLIATGGSLLRENRFKDLIWANDILKIIHDDVHLLILGEGPHRRGLERYQKNVRIEDRVHFLGWREDARQLLALADVFWLAGDRQGMPTMLLEAMAAGLPAVAADTPGHRAIVKPGETGFLVPTGDRAALAKFAHRLLEDGELARRMGDAARQDVLARFPVTAMVNRYAELYRRLLA